VRALASERGADVGVAVGVGVGVGLGMGVGGCGCGCGCGWPESASDRVFLRASVSAHMLKKIKGKKRARAIEFSLEHVCRRALV